MQARCGRGTARQFVTRRARFRWTRYLHGRPTFGKLISIVVEESGDGAAQRKTTQFRVHDGSLQRIRQDGPRAKASGAHAIREKLFGGESLRRAIAHVLPVGYPHSVTEAYADYSKWQFASMSASAAAGVLSTQALLFAMGLGAGAIPMAAALNWVLKDGLGQLGGVAFSSLVSTRFDSNPKLWRVVAAAALDAATLLELATVTAPHLFLPMAAVANVGKNISFLAASASRAAIHNTFVRRENLADITAKAGAQSILASMVGTGAGIVISAAAESQLSFVAPAAVFLCSLHLLTNWWSLRRVVLPTVDEQRLGLLIDAYNAEGSILTPAEAAALERPIMYPLKRALNLNTKALPHIRLGAPLTAAVANGRELQRLFEQAEGAGSRYMLAARTDDGESTAAVFVLLLKDAVTEDVLQSAHHARAVQEELSRRGYAANAAVPTKKWDSGNNNAHSGPSGQMAWDVMAEITAARDPAAFQQRFVRQLKLQEWRLDVLFLDDEAARLRLEVSGGEEDSQSRGPKEAS